MDIKKLGQAKIYRLRAKKNKTYPAIKLPSELESLIGRKAEIFELRINGTTYILLSFGNDFEVLKLLSYGRLEKRLQELESRLNSLYIALNNVKTVNYEENHQSMDRWGFEPQASAMPRRRSSSLSYRPL